MASKGKNKNGIVSELRRDLVTGNWIVVAKGRGARPHAGNREKESENPIKTCPFEDPKASGNEDPLLIYKDGEDWSLQVIPNKYPAFAGGQCGVITKSGPYSVQDGRGFHEVIITRDHSKHIALLSQEKVAEVFRAYKERYLALKNDECVKYVSIFHNHGKGAGASLTHPHSQLIAIPILPSDIRRSLSGSSVFYRKHGKCVHCAMLDWEREDKKRVVFQNKEFIAICPFVSRDAYEVRIFPQNHTAYFEEINDEEIELLAEAFKEVLGKIYEKLNNPPYNFYLHTAPIGGNEFDQYHWHFEVRPKTETDAGFEFGTGVEISTVEPEYAAAILRE
jgi:UDPglucose--hexose-1-phosphate uridylyltransferase